MKTAANMDVKSLFVGYKMALDDVSGGILEQALTDFIKGQAEGHSAVFLPTPAELRGYCEKLTQFAKGQIRYAQSLLDAPEEMGRAERVSPDRLRALMATIGTIPANQTRH